MCLGSMLKGASNQPLSSMLHSFVFEAINYSSDGYASANHLGLIAGEGVVHSFANLETTRECLTV